jgi:hypothetical protein
MRRDEDVVGGPPAAGAGRRWRTPGPRGGGAGTLAVASGALVLGLVFFLPFAMRPADTQAYYLGFALFLLTLLPVVVRLVGGSLDIFEPIVPISLLIGFAFGFRAMYLVYDPTIFSSNWLTRVSFDDYLNRALLMAVAAYGALLVGYYVVAVPAVRLLRERPYVPHRIWPARLSGVKVLTLVVIAFTATLGRVGSSGLAAAAGQDEVTSATFAVGVLATFAEYAACILALHIAAGDDRRWLSVALWLGVLPLVMFQTLAFGGKTQILLALYAIMAARHYARRRLSLPLVTAAVAVAILLVFPTVNAFRIPSERSLTASSARPTLQEFAARVTAIPTLFAGMSPSEYARFAAESVVGRANGIDSLAVIMKYSGAVELGNPTAYWQIPLYAFVPRAIWPDKPVILTGTEFARLFVTPTEEGLTSYPSIGVFHVGDLYASFGAAGVLIGMCVLGGLFRVAYQLFDPARSPDLGMKFLYIVLLWGIVNGFESDIPTIYGNLLKTLVIWVLIKLWFNARAAEASPGFGRSRVRASVVPQYALRPRHTSVGVGR